METVASQYIAWDPCDETREQIEELLKQGNISELEKVLSTRLEFGTAGLRGPMGAGYNHMNDLVILQTIQGVIVYLQNTLGEDDARDKGVIIGYDHRQKGSLSSKHFADICVAVLLSQNFRVLLLDDFVPTPFVPFGVTHFGCACGIMVTASHNPKEDDGFKVYWGNGSQIIPPHDIGIAKCIVDNLEPWDNHLDTTMSHFSSTDRFRTCTDELAKSYFNRLQSLSIPREPLSDPLKIAYTAMHGVGSKWIDMAFSYVRPTNNMQPLLHVPCQKSPDPSFPTVRFPNPEEKGALDESMHFANLHHCKVVIANDPDADRLAAAENQALSLSENSWRVFTGNEIGIMLGYYQIQNYLEKKKQSSVFGLTIGPAAVVTTVVSSKMLKKIAEVEGIKYSDTLTGFKWIGNECIRLQAEGYELLFSYEEALGYCVGDALTDKDGISAAVVFCELSNQLYASGSTLAQYLERIYSSYGLFVSYNTYVFSYDKNVTDSIFERLRNGGTNGGYIMSVGNTQITRVRDITLGFDSGARDKTSALPLTPGSHMIMYEFDNCCTVILRTSGTEPKIKCYSEISSEDRTQDAITLKNVLKSFVDECISFMLQPHLNGLVSA